MNLESDLAVFGLSHADDADDHWLGQFRSAAEDAALGAIGPYRIVSEAGRGGQGVVYRARRNGDQHDVAIKRLASGAFADGPARARLMREAELAASLRHPSIVTVLGVSLIDGQPVLAMEWIDGVPITRWADGDVTATGRRPTDELLAMFLSICDAVHHAHQRAVIHRDLKPSNILVDSAGLARVLDFGLAKATGAASLADRGATATGHFLGTPAFASPEQAAGRADQIDARTDIYSLGAVLYRMLTGREPIRTGGSLAEVLHAIAEEPPARPSSITPHLSRDLDAIVLKALHKRPEERYQSVESLAADLRRFRAGEPVEARAPSEWYRVRKYVARHRTGTMAVGAAVLLLATIGSAAAVMAARLASERHRVVAAQQRESESRQVAERVASFLSETLATARPTRDGADATVLEAMAGAAKRAETQLADQPAAAAEVYYTIGYTYRSLWMYREAVPHLERAAELATRSHGREHETVAKSLAALGACLANMREERSVEVEREGLQIREALLARGSGNETLVAESRMRLGYALHRGSIEPNWHEAGREMDAALAIYMRIFGEQHRETASCLHNIGYLRWRHGDGAGALEYYGRSARAFRSLAEPDRAGYAECLYGYGSLLADQDQPREAIAVLRELRPLVSELYGEDREAQPMMTQAGIHLALEEAAEAEGLYVAAISLRARKLVRIHPDDAPTLRTLQRELGATGPAPGKCVAALRDALGAISDSARTELEQAAIGLAWARAAQGDLGGAEGLFNTLVSTAAPGAVGATRALPAADGLAVCAAARGDLDRAALLIQKWTTERAGGSEAFMQFRVGKRLVALHHPEEARRMLGNALAALVDHSGPEHPTTREAERLLRLLDSDPEPAAGEP